MISRFALLLIAGSLACSQEEASLLHTGEWVDLTHEFSPETVYWPTAKPFELEVVSAERTPAGYYYSANNFTAAEHGGTHLDAPVHFGEGKWTTEQIPLERLIGEAIVLDVRKEADADPDYLIDLPALRAWGNGRGIPEGSIVLFRTGWSRRWPDRASYLGTSQRGSDAVAQLHFPGIDSAAASWLVQRKVRAVGIDTPSIDAGQSRSFPSHQILAAANVPAFENLTNLDRLPLSGAFVVALPMKIRGGSGGPLRMVALIPR